VDDSAACRGVLGALLRGAGYSVHEAGDGRQALERLRSGPAPCLIVLDLHMPGMDGPAFREAQRRDPALAGIPVLVTGGHGPEEAAALDPAGYLAKPADLDEVLRQVRRLCPAPVAAAPVRRCRRCGSRRTTRSRRGRLARLAGWLRLYPYRCLACGARFWRFG
jgi:CheY-like chemotaxis protein